MTAADVHSGRGAGGVLLPVAFHTSCSKADQEIPVGLSCITVSLRLMFGEGACDVLGDRDERLRRETATRPAGEASRIKDSKGGNRFLPPIFKPTALLQSLEHYCLPSFPA